MNGAVLAGRGHWAAGAGWVAGQVRPQYRWWGPEEVSRCSNLLTSDAVHYLIQQHQAIMQPVLCKYYDVSIQIVEYVSLEEQSATVTLDSGQDSELG